MVTEDATHSPSKILRNYYLLKSEYVERPSADRTTTRQAQGLTSVEIMFEDLGARIMAPLAA
jgi:hypothetical protein